MSAKAGTLVAGLICAALLGPVALTAMGDSAKRGLTCRGEPATVTGTPGNDTGSGAIEGTAGPDVIVAQGGNDEIRAKGGGDLICGDTGRDYIDAGDGADRGYGGAARDVLVGGKGRDRLFGQAGSDGLNGEGGRDLCKGQAGKDFASRSGCERIKGARAV